MISLLQTNYWFLFFNYSERRSELHTLKYHHSEDCPQAAFTDGMGSGSSAYCEKKATASLMFFLVLGFENPSNENASKNSGEALRNTISPPS
jgi:hypothetical protein